MPLPSHAPITAMTCHAATAAIAVHQIGNADGMSVVFLHGNSLSATGHPEWWSTWATPARRVIAMDFPGHGQSPWCDSWTTYSLPELAQAVITMLAQLRIQRPVLIGHSLGGNVAMEIGAQGLPLRGIVTIGSPPLPSPLPLGGLPLPPALLALFIAQPTADELHELGTMMFHGSVPTWWLEEFRATDPRVRSGLAAAVSTHATWRDQVAFVRDFQEPLLLIGGEHDPLGQVEALRPLRQQWWGDGPQVIPGASHMAIDHPRIRELIERFCADCARR